MNQSLHEGLKTVESAFAFIKAQVDTDNIRKQKQILRRKRLLNRLVAVGTMAMLMAVTALPRSVVMASPLEVQDEPANQPIFDSSVKLDTQSYSLLVVERPTVEIKPGKSLAQEEAEKARAKAIVKAGSARVATSSTPQCNNVRASSSDEAHRLAQDAAAKAGIADHWKELAAVWEAESGKMVYTCVVSRIDKMAQGPLQFMKGTFAAYAADGDGDGQADIHNAKDALVAAANLLKRGGIAEGKVDQAIFNYNHSMAYVNKVKRIASSIQ